MVASVKGNSHQISEEERMIRNHEMELLATISAPPGKDGAHLEELVKKHKMNILKGEDAAADVEADADATDDK